MKAQTFSVGANDSGVEYADKKINEFLDKNNYELIDIKVTYCNNFGFMGHSTPSTALVYTVLYHDKAIL